MFVVLSFSSDGSSRPEVRFFVQTPTQDAEVAAYTYISKRASLGMNVSIIEPGCSTLKPVVITGEDHHVTYYHV